MHIQPINQVFSPSKKDVDQARRIVEVYEQAESEGLGATSIDGRMIDEATYKIANETITTSEMIINRENMWKAMSEKMREKGNST